MAACYPSPRRGNATEAARVHGAARRVCNGGRFVRFENLDTDSGPDLRVYLSEASASGDAGTIDDAFVDLGPLKGDQGNQNYAIPGGVELDDIRSVSVWCRPFSVGFGVAPLVVR